MQPSEWEKRNEDYCNEIAGDDDLEDEEYCEVLEDLIDRAESALTAKREEMGDDD